MAGGLYSPSAGDVLTAANAIDYWSKQVVIICTAGTRPTPREGMVIYQTDTDTVAVYATAWCEITPIYANVETTETTTSTSYADLSTGGPTLASYQTSTKVLLQYGGASANTVGGSSTWASFACSGATTVAASDTYGCATTGAVYAGFARSVLYTSLTAGGNVFKMRYRVSANTGGWQQRTLVAQGIPA